MELAAMQQVGGRSPQHDGGEGLVGKSEVTPQHPKGNEVQSDAHDKQRDGYHQTVLVRALIIADSIGNGQTGSTEGRIAGCHGQHHNAEDGKGATKHAKQFHGNVVHDQRGVPLGAEGGGKSGRIGVEGHAEGHPDKPDNTFRNHRTVKDLTAMLFVVDAPGGGGKTPVMPNYVISQTPGKVILRNYEGVITTYTEPAHYEPHCTCDVCTGKRKANVVGVAALEQGLQMTIEPADLARVRRHSDHH